MGFESLAYLDLQMMTCITIATDSSAIVKYLVKAMRHYSDKEILSIPYNMGNHWVLLAISMRHDHIWCRT
jgi:hypothetical protein